MIREASIKDVDSIVGLALKLWPDEDAKDLGREFTEQLQSPNFKLLLAFQNEVPIGFIQLSLRFEFVEGSTQSPTGYVEGIFVEPEFRKSGWALKLIEAGEIWAASKGCKEIASDVELDNSISQDFHLKVGFKETNRLVTYIKPIVKQIIP